MSGAQTPLWVAFALAGIALIGPIGAAWLVSRRDDKRWTRERDREDLRYERERQRLADERAHAARLHWSEKRVEAFGHYLATLDAWLRHARFITTLSHELPDRDRLNEMGLVANDLHEQTGPIQLMTGDEDTRWLVMELVGKCQLVQLRAAIADEPAKIADLTSGVASIITKRSELFQLFRMEIVGPRTSAPELNGTSPAPPSGKTS
ncbi:hypothetical protein ACFYOT_21920 [Saccharothrix saharensis]|uniref:hypothetical protein n=1 Tax=Saccharothrix saharensis TaxID=571190 RepID=UPI0036931D0E